MPEKQQYIEEITQQTLKSINKTDNWFNYLKSAALHYKYSFHETYYIYSQRPDATAVASYDQWNKQMNRFINAGAKGIALLDASGNNKGLKYVFDISDTNGERMPFIWQMKNKYSNKISADISDAFELDKISQQFESTIEQIVDKIIDDNMPDILQEVTAIKDGTIFEELDDDNIEVILKTTLKESVLATVLTRCGYEYEAIDFDFSRLHFFNTTESIVQLGQMATEISETILREVEISVKAIENNIRQGRSVEDATAIPGTRRDDDTQRDDKRTISQSVDQVRNDEEETPAGQHERKISDNAYERDTISTLQGSGATSQGTDEPASKENEESNTAEPVAYEDIGDRGSDNQTDDIGEIDEQADIDHVLLGGSGFAGGKQRIIDFYFEEHTNTEKITFLKKEFGTGGGSATFPAGNSGFQMHDAKGITIHNQGFDYEPIKLTWAKVSKRIGELIDGGRYFEQRHPKEKPLIKPIITDGVETLGADEAPFLVPENNDLHEKKRRTQAEMNFVRLAKLAAHIMDKRYSYAKLQSDGYIDLSIEWIGEDRLAMAHYGKQNGDLMADPDMELIVDFEKKTVLPATYQNDYLGVYQEVYAQNDKWRPKLSKQLTSFLSTWFRNIEFQGHVLTEAKYFDEDLMDTPIIFDDKGLEHGHDIPHDIISTAKLEELQSESEDVIELDYNIGDTIIEVSSSYEFTIAAIDDAKIVYANPSVPERGSHEMDREKFDSYIRSRVFEIIKSAEYDIGYGSLGNGITIWNSLVEVNGDYKNLAHVSEEGTITYYMDDLPQDIISRIERIAEPYKLDTVKELPHTRLAEDKLEQSGLFDEPKEHAPIQTEKVNFHITDTNLSIGGAKERFRQNIKAVKLLKVIENENRLATSDEQEILSQYVGWGGLSKAFDDMDNSWADEYAQLQNTLEEGEYSEARASTLNAFYTSPTVIKAMYNALENMGFTDGNILEPAMGIGNFFGLLPASMGDAKMYGVELDSISGRIAKQLYQREDIQITGFEHTAYPDNFFDVAIGNVPFGAYAIADSRYDKHKFNVHDYFFAKSLDKVRPGGVIAFITSKGTMDKKNSNVRKYLAQRAELIGAIRLPNNAFKANAGTDVTSDIIFLKKRESVLDIEPDWVHRDITDDGLAINQYFVENPSMVLGTLNEQIGMYGAKEITCIPNEDTPLGEQLLHAISHVNAEIEENIYMIDEPDMDDNSIPADPNVKNYSYCIRDDKLYYRENSRMHVAQTNNKAKDRVIAMIGLRTTLSNLIGTQMDGHAQHDIKKQQSRLDTQYGEFVSKYGRINSKANNMAMSEDSSYYLLCSLEIFNDEGDFDRKADIFTKNTIRPYREITRVDTASEALAISLARKGKVDIGYIGNLTRKEPQQVIDDLEGVIYKDPMSDVENIYDGWQTADEYLSGDVREKLNLAKLVAKDNPEFLHHVSALEKVQPKDLEASDIDVKIGTIWIPPRYYEKFIFETLNTPNYHRFDIKVQYSNHSGAWNISSKSADYSNVNANQKFGTSRMNAYWIMEETLNLKNVQIKDRVVEPDGTVKYISNKKETMLARQKQTQLSDAFKDWIFKDEERRNHLVRLYNDTYNNNRPREYDGSHLDFFGMNPEIELRSHQKNAVARQLYGGNALLAHVVGAGKSFTMIAAAMESKRLGLSNKNLFTVPNHLTEQLAAETLRLYPSAKVLVATKKDFKTKNRKKFCSRIATGDYDIVILGHTQFEKIPLSQDRVYRMLLRQIDDITTSIADQRRSAGSNFNVKQMEKTKKSMQARLEKLNDYSKKDDVIEFEELGIDRLFVDESQYFKNLFLVTKMRNVAGIQQTETKKSTDMLMKGQYLDEITGGRGITFASGTPISNSMTELFTVQRYLQMNELRKRGLEHFDSWASVFGEIETAYELAPEGGKFRSKSRFAKFYNLPELMSMFKNVADVQTNDMLNLPMPKLKGGKHINISVLPSDIQKNMIAELGDRADEVRDRAVEPNVDNMLKITNDGRKIALDQRLINPLLPDDANSKVNTAMKNIYDIWERTKDEKSTQLVFCDISTPKKNGKFNIYDDLKKKWIDKGIPEDEIAFIHDSKNEIQKARLFAKVRSGEVRILMGSTQMMGAGTNVQSKLIAVHHLDCPWRPADLEQRDGRILRQGNNNDEVEIYRYVTEETFDSYSYQLVEQKQKFIGQIMTSKAPMRSAADLDEAALSYAEVKALATGNPLIKECMELEVEVSRLKLLKSEHRNQQYRYETQISTTIPNKITKIIQRIDGLKKDIATVSMHANQDFNMTIKGIAYTEKKDAGQVLLSIVSKLTDDKAHEVGEYKGMKLYVQNTSFFSSAKQVILQGAISHTVDMGDDAFGNIQRIDNMIKNMSDNLQHKGDELETAKGQLEVAKHELNKPFEHELALKQKEGRLRKINHELSMDKKDNVVEVGEDEPKAEKSIIRMER